MTQSAVVETLTRSGDAMIRVYQKSACGHDCSDCSGICGSKRSITVQAKNPLGAGPGDLVTVETATGKLLKAAALVYLLPLGTLLLGCVLSYLLGASERIQAFSGLGGLILGCLGAVLINRFVRRDRPQEFTIIDVSGHIAENEEA